MMVHDDDHQGAPAREGSMNTESYEYLRFERPNDGVLLITISRPERANAANTQMLEELTRVWTEIGDDVETSVAVITGDGRTFCPGGDLGDVANAAGDIETIPRELRAMNELVSNIIALDKPVISAINGFAAASGLAIALTADISIISTEAEITDGHVLGGLVAGDHAALIWPLLCSMAKAKYYLLTGFTMTGSEAERIGLVTMAVPPREVVPGALEVAAHLASGPQLAIRWTKRSLNSWYRQAAPIFEQSTALELLSLLHPDALEGVRALREHRKPSFPSSSRSDG
jgi:enoyl-CoA hydratase